MNPTSDRLAATMDFFQVRGTPVTRLARLIRDAIDAGDLEMARRCAQRIIELGGKR